ncbi:MAG: hypothetical protein ACOCUD_01550 [Bacillota bacterium]
MKKLLLIIGSIFLLIGLAACDEDTNFTIPDDTSFLTSEETTSDDTTTSGETTTGGEVTTGDGTTTTTEATSTTEETTTEETTTEETTTEETTTEETTYTSQLSSPTNLTIDGNVLTWDEVEDATSYYVYKNGVFLEEVTTNSYDFSALDDDVIDFNVKAIGSGDIGNSPISLTITYMVNSATEIAAIKTIMQNSGMQVSDEDAFVTELVNRGMTSTEMQTMMNNLGTLMGEMETAESLSDVYPEIDALMESMTNVEALMAALIKVELPAAIQAEIDSYSEISSADSLSNDYNYYNETNYITLEEMQYLEDLLYFLENHSDEAIQSAMVVVNYLMGIQDNITTDWIDDLETLMETPSPDQLDILLAISVKNEFVNILKSELPTLEEFTIFNQTMISLSSIMLEDNTMETYIQAPKLSQQMQISFNLMYDYLLMIDSDYINGMLAALSQEDELIMAEDILVLQLEYLNMFLDDNQAEIDQLKAIYTEAEKEAFFFDIIVTQYIYMNFYPEDDDEFNDLMLLFEENIDFNNLLSLQTFAGENMKALLDQLVSTDFALIHEVFDLMEVQRSYDTYPDEEAYYLALQGAQFDLVDSLFMTINPIIQDATNEEKTMVMENIFSVVVIGLEMNLDYYEAKDGACAYYDPIDDMCVDYYDFTEEIQNTENMLLFLENNSEDAIQSVLIVFDYFMDVQNNISSEWLEDLETLMQTPSPDQLDILLAISVKNELINNLKNELPTLEEFTLFNQTMLTFSSIMLEDSTMETYIQAPKLAEQMVISFNLFYDYLLMIDSDYVNEMLTALSQEDELMMKEGILILQLEYLDMFLDDNQAEIDQLKAIYTESEKETIFFDVIVTQLINNLWYQEGTTEFDDIMLLFEENIDFNNLLSLKSLTSDNMNALLDQLVLTDFALIYDAFALMEVQQNQYDYVDPENYYHDLTIAQFELMDSLVMTTNPIIQDMTAAEYSTLIDNILSIVTLGLEIEDYEYSVPELPAFELIFTSIQDTSADQLAIIQAIFAEVDSSDIINDFQALYIEGFESENPDMQTYGTIIEIANAYVNIFLEAEVNMEAIMLEIFTLIDMTEIQNLIGITQDDADDIELMLDDYLEAVYNQALVIKDYDYNNLTASEIEQIENFINMVEAPFNQPEA